MYAILSEQFVGAHAHRTLLLTESGIVGMNWDSEPFKEFLPGHCPATVIPKSVNHCVPDPRAQTCGSLSAPDVHPVSRPFPLGPSLIDIGLAPWTDRSGHTLPDLSLLECTSFLRALSTLRLPLPSSVHPPSTGASARVATAHQTPVSTRIRFGTHQLWEEFRDPEQHHAFVRVPKQFLVDCKHQIMEDLQRQGSTEWVGTSDILLAWWYKRRRSIGQYIGNTIGFIPVPPIPIRVFNDWSVRQLALHLRRAIHTYHANPARIQDGLYYAFANPGKLLFPCPAGAEWKMSTGWLAADFAVPTQSWLSFVVVNVRRVARRALASALNSVFTNSPLMTGKPSNGNKLPWQRDAAAEDQRAPNRPSANSSEAPPASTAVSRGSSAISARFRASVLAGRACIVSVWLSG
ncbi:hypothetical protein FB45DRAFT_1004763 [Roridomyces roridus]|uniref:Uncharacterized protein n=1 Tax=Roridomyces roridus TaxID=1738132 RepID=A0AAD7BQE0_9AGAR|nr:hypothetical protein FB45DRAFT_1004763 [Roridomyces roridus]